jgi:hypothetical protein
MSFFRGGRKRDRETNFVDKSIHVSTANHYDSDGLCSLCDTEQSKKQAKNLKFQDLKINVWIKIQIYFLNLITKNWGSCKSNYNP